MGGADPDQEAIDRRSDNAEATPGCLGRTLGCAWTVSGGLLVAPLPHMMERL